MMMGRELVGRICTATVVLSGGLFAPGCGASSSSSSTSGGERNTLGIEGVSLDCGAGSEAKLVLGKKTRNPTRRALLAWDTGAQTCDLRSGNSAPNGMDPVLQFAEVNGVVDVFSVVPWQLSTAPDVDPADELKPGVEHTVFLSRKKDTIGVQFTHEDGWITLSNVVVEK